MREALHELDVLGIDERRSGLMRALRTAGRALQRNPNMLLGLVIIVLMSLMALLAPLLTTYDPVRLNVIDRLEGPSGSHWFGTDHLGRDVYTRVVYGARVSLLVGASVAIFTSVAGILLGLVSGYFPLADAFIMRIMDALMSFPSFLLAIALVATMSPGMWTVIIAITVVDTPRTARVARASVLSLRAVDYVLAARALGAPALRIMFNHILPNCFAPIMVQATFVFAVAILIEAGLSFLGTGVPPEIATWGNIMGDGRRVAKIAVWVIFFPGLFLSLTVLAINLIGDGLRDALDPKLRGKL